MLVIRSPFRSRSPKRPTARARAPRRGFTLGEMIVALVLFSMVGGGILTLVMRQQRFYRSTAEIIKQQGQLRQGASVLPLDLRGVSTSDITVNSPSTSFDADFYGRSDWYIDFRRTFGSSLICAMRTATAVDTIMVYPKSLNAVAAVSSWGIAPIEGDSVLVLDDWTMVGPGDDRWRAYEVKSVTPVTGKKGCPWKVEDADPVAAGLQPDSTPLLFAADTVRASYQIALSPDAGSNVSPSIIIGAPVRFFRRVRYEAYQAADQHWYLGYSDCLRTYETWNKCGEVTPVSGPYRPYTGVASENGLVFAYYDANGNELGPSDQSRLISRVGVIMRSQTQTEVTRTGSGPTDVYRDSLLFSIGIRNRR